MSGQNSTSECEVRFLLPSGFVFSDIQYESMELIESGMTVEDKWFVPSNIATYELHEAWLNQGGAAPIRVRVTERVSGTVCVMEVKQLGHTDDYSHAREVKVRGESPAMAQEFLEAIGFKLVAATHKERQVYRHHDGLLICVDDYGPLGTILEIESRNGSDDVVALHKWSRRFLGRSLEELKEPIALAQIRKSLK